MRQAHPGNQVTNAKNKQHNKNASPGTLHQRAGLKPQSTQHQKEMTAQVQVYEINLI